MKSRDYSLYNYSADHVTETWGRIMDNGQMLMCKIYPNTEEFEIIFMHPSSINITQTSKCGSLLREDHFFKIELSIETIIDRIVGFNRRRHNKDG